MFNDVNHIHLSNMASPNRVVSWTTPCASTELVVTLSVSAHINDVATPPIMTSWIHVISLTFFIQPRSHNLSSKCPNELFISWFNCQYTVGFRVFSIRWADRDRRLWNTIGRSGSHDRIWADCEWIVSGIGPWWSVAPFTNMAKLYPQHG